MILCKSEFLLFLKKTTRPRDTTESVQWHQCRSATLRAGTHPGCTVLLGDPRLFGALCNLDGNQGLEVLLPNSYCSQALALLQKDPLAKWSGKDQPNKRSAAGFWIPHSGNSNPVSMYWLGISPLGLEDFYLLWKRETNDPECKKQEKTQPVLLSKSEVKTDPIRKVHHRLGSNSSFGYTTTSPPAACGQYCYISLVEGPQALMGEGGSLRSHSLLLR